MTLKVVTRTHNNKMRLTNVVYQANLNVKIDLSCLVHQFNNVRYNPRIFPGLIYQNRKIGGNCLIFSNGKINCSYFLPPCHDDREFILHVTYAALYL